MSRELLIIAGNRLLGFLIFESYRLHEEAGITWETKRVACGEVVRRAAAAGGSVPITALRSLFSFYRQQIKIVRMRHACLSIVSFSSRNLL